MRQPGTTFVVNSFSKKSFIIVFVPDSLLRTWRRRRDRKVPGIKTVLNDLDLLAPDCSTVHLTKIDLLGATEATVIAFDYNKVKFHYKLITYLYGHQNGNKNIKTNFS